MFLRRRILSASSIPVQSWCIGDSVFVLGQFCNPAPDYFDRLMDMLPVHVRVSQNHSKCFVATDALYHRTINATLD
jgi:hypothetical protein